ncbi:S24 family peptidase [Rhizobium sp. CBN3]|uniref:S24 family peptidase n=1 Tax=Rhizobium sp. CBN3 TaxID=3058045 RepID=UPI002671B65A|nr:S24 family peptidase [Rhizobium sp. CBN3]MDO3434361.1 S24 family peptidase [Rhizobium sp. CBN3]
MSRVSSILLNVHNAHQTVKAKRTLISCKMHTMEYDDRPEPAKRLEKARIARGFDEAKKAASFFGWNYNVYAQHENGTRGISRAAGAYAKAFRVSEAWLLTGEGAGPGETTANVPGLRRVTVAAHIQAGVFEETWEWDEHSQYPVYVPDDPEYAPFQLYAGETRGPSMNKRYPERTVLVFTNVEETQEQPIPGKRYIVERRRSSGEAEHTVKLLHMDQEGKYWLLPESDDPRFQVPISIEEGTGDDDIVAIIGRVAYAVTRE